MDIDSYLQRWATRKATELADQWVEPLNEFLLAPSREAAAALLRRHQDLSNSVVRRILDDRIAETAREGNAAANARLRERRAML
jgi:hypothetical protein